MAILAGQHSHWCKPEARRVLFQCWGSAMILKSLCFSLTASEEGEQKGFPDTEGKESALLGVQDVTEVVTWSTRTGWTQVYLNRLLEACSVGRTSQSVLPALGPLPGAISNGLEGQKVSLLSLWRGFFAGKLWMFFGVGSARRLSCWKVWKDLEVTGEIKSSSLHFPICKMRISNASALHSVFCLL